MHLTNQRFTAVLISLFISISGMSSFCYSHQASTLKSIKDFKVEKLSKNIYIIHGPLTLPSKQYQGFNNNPAFIISKKGIIIVDPGSSVDIGRELLNKIKTVSKLPVIAVFNTHVHGDHWLGNQAIVEKYPKVVIYAHEKMIEQIKAGADKQWINIMNRMTENATKNTKATSPNKGLKGGEKISFSNIQINIHHPSKKAHTNTDIMIEVNNDKALFLGDIITRGSLSTARAQDGSIPGQIKAIKFALASKNTLFIPGHGQSGDQKFVKMHLNFLQQLKQLTFKYFEQGLQSHEIKAKLLIELNKYKHWKNFKQIGKIIHQEFIRIENESI